MARTNGHTRWQNRIVGEDMVDADQLLANPTNWRIHPKHQQAALTGVLDNVGWVQRVIVNQRTGHVIDGHLRASLAISRGEQVPVIYVDVDEDEERLILATLDPLAAMAATDAEMLEDLLRGLGDTALVQDDEGLRALLGAVAGEAGIAQGNGAAADPGAQVDRAEELRELWQTGRGQVWEVPSATVSGRAHRVMCGDSTSAEDVARLMGGEKVDAVVTDPPYGVGVDYGEFKDTEANVSNLINQFMPILQALDVPIALTPGVPAMWSYPRPAWVMVWVHPAPSGSCPWGFAGVNPIMVYGKDPYLQAGLGRRPDSISLAADREDVEGHPTPKPLKVWVWLVERMTTGAGRVIFDPFTGSGTGFVAAEQTGRVCYGMEIEPKYVAVTLQRLADMGLEPVLVE